MHTPSTAALRQRDGHAARVTPTELFFDLVYVFAVTQLSHKLLGSLSLLGGLQTLVLWFPVWLGWQYTCWVSNWFNPDSRPVRFLLFAVMGVALVMAAALPLAFDTLGLVFAASYVLLQVGRTVWVLGLLPAGHPLAANFRRILGWLCISGVFWLAGGLVGGPARLALWAVAAACEYVSPMFGFALPRLGRSSTADWTVEGGHIAERCQLFVIMALGESILVTGATLSQSLAWTPGVLGAFGLAFVASLAMWWMYFHTTSQAAEHAITHSADPGRLAAFFHYVHLVIVAGVIIGAVGSELVIAHPDGHMQVKYAAVVVGGPLVYVAGNGLLKQVVYGRFPLSHVAGLGGLVVLAALSWLMPVWMACALATALLVMVAVWETVARRRRVPHQP